jgi:hypothetical protein
MGIVLIIAGFGLIHVAAQNYRRIEPQRAIVFQGPLGGLLHMLLSLAAIGFVIAGILILFA